MQGFLDSGDLGNPTWKKISEHINWRIAILQKQLEADQEDTEFHKIRGRIKELRRLLAGAEGEKPLQTSQPRLDSTLGT